MSIFSSILHKILGTEGPAPIAPASVNVTEAESAAPGLILPDATTISAEAGPVDVEAVLSKMAEAKGGGGNWRTSIVDLLKLLDLDSSMDARRQLAGELQVHAGADGSPEQNIALHKAVMRKVAESGGTVPDSLKG